jgi:hypothetical protein
MKADILFLVLLNAFGLSQFVPVLRLPQHLMDAYGPWVTGGYCGILFLLYPIIQSVRFRSRFLRYFSWLGRLLLMLFISTGIWIAVDVWLRPVDRGEWALGAFFTIVPALVVGLPALTVGFKARELSTYTPSNQSPEPTAGRCDDHVWFYETVLDVCRARPRQRWLSSVSLDCSRVMSIDDQLRLSRMVFCAAGTPLILSLYAIKLALFRSAQSWSRITAYFAAALLLAIPIRWLISPDWKNQDVSRFSIWIGTSLLVLTVPFLSFLYDCFRDGRSVRQLVIRALIEIFIIMPIWAFIWLWITIHVFQWVSIWRAV